MSAEEIYKLMNQNPVFYLATEEGDQPRVRGMLLFKADKDGIIFHTASTKDLYKQLCKNPKAELCFSGGGTQVRVTGVLEEVEDETLKEEIFNHPTRKFLKPLKDKGLENMLKVFKMQHGTAVTWTMADNFKEKQPVKL